VCREAIVGNNKLLHAVNKMVDLAEMQTNHQSRCAGNGFKPPKGALVKSQGTERLGESYPGDRQV